MLDFQIYHRRNLAVFQNVIKESSNHPSPSHPILMPLLEKSALFYPVTLGWALYLLWLMGYQQT